MSKSGHLITGTPLPQVQSNSTGVTRLLTRHRKQFLEQDIKWQSVRSRAAHNQLGFNVHCKHCGIFIHLKCNCIIIYMYLFS